MNASDLIVVAPWIIFAVGLAVISVRLHRSRRRDDAHEGDAQEAQCPETRTDTPR